MKKLGKFFNFFGFTKNSPWCHVITLKRISCQSSCCECLSCQNLWFVVHRTLLLSMMKIATSKSYAPIEKVVKFRKHSNDQHSLTGQLSEEYPRIAHSIPSDMYSPTESPKSVHLNSALKMFNA